MKTEWDYSDLAEAYINRPNYSNQAVYSMLKTSNVRHGDQVCDIGAGVAHLTLMLASEGLSVIAVEPNDNMRRLGEKRTSSHKKVFWVEASGEETKQDDQVFDLVTFGSSFNVCDQNKALSEVKRILKPLGWFACMWNHRNLEDAVQKEIEEIIKSEIPNYGYGARREDQTGIINRHGGFENVIRISSDITHSVSINECITAWKSHATLERQAGKKFKKIISKIESYLFDLKIDVLQVPYSTNIWMAQLLDSE